MIVAHEIIKSIIGFPKNRLMIELTIIPIKPKKRYVLILDKSLLVKCPYTARLKNRAVVIVIAKIIEQTPIETSIDFYINAEYLVGNNKKALAFINSVYKKLEEQYEFKGVALHK